MTSSRINEPPFIHFVNVRKLPKRGQHVVYEAPMDVRAAIAQELDLISVEEFNGKCVVAPWKRDGIRVSGVVRARFTQPCALTSGPLVSKISEEFEALYVPEGSKLAKPTIDSEGDWVLNVEGDDPPDVFSGDSIDIGATLLEFFALAIDPFAKSPDACFTPLSADEKLDNARQSPFAVLESLKKH